MWLLDTSTCRKRLKNPFMRKTVEDGSELVTLGSFIRMEVLKLLVSFHPFFISTKNPQPFLPDRKKDLVKLQHGEYLSLGKIESELKTCQIVENICVYADSTKTYCIALVQPAEKALADLATSIGVITKGSSEKKFEELCRDDRVLKAATSFIGEYGRRRNLNKFEIPTKISLCEEAWTPDSGLVTAAFKIKRKEIQTKYREEIKRLYS